MIRIITSSVVNNELSKHGSATDTWPAPPQGGTRHSAPGLGKSEFMN